MKRKTIISTILLVLISLFCITKVNAEDNLLSSEGAWTNEYVTDWTSATGEFTSENETSFEVKATSIGNTTVSEWGAQAHLKNKKVNFVSGDSYQFEGTIVSDKDRQILIKIEDPSNTSNIFLEKWVTLEANKEYNFSEKFMSKFSKEEVSIYFAYGYNSKDNSSVQNSANNIKVSNLKLTKVKTEYGNIKYNAVTKGDASVEEGVYYFFNEYGGQNVILEKIPSTADQKHVIPSGLVGSEDTNSIYFSLSKAPVTSVKINNKDVDFYTNTGALAYVPLDLFKNEYSEVTIFSNDELLAKIIIYNKGVTNAKEKVKEQLDEYLTDNSSDELKKLVEEVKQSVDSATSEEEINSIVETNKDKIELQKAKDDAINALTKAMGKNYSQNVKNIYDKASSKIEEATSKEEVEKILKEAEKEIADQLAKEKAASKKTESISKNPFTFDNILIYFIIFALSTIITIASVKNIKLKGNN